MHLMGLRPQPHMHTIHNHTPLPRATKPMRTKVIFIPPPETRPSWRRQCTHDRKGASVPFLWRDDSVFRSVRRESDTAQRYYIWSRTLVRLLHLRSARIADKENNCGFCDEIKYYVQLILNGKINIFRSNTRRG